MKTKMKQKIRLNIPNQWMQLHLCTVSRKIRDEVTFSPCFWLEKCNYYATMALLPLGVCGHSRWKSAQISRETHETPKGGDFNAELEPGFGVERASVGPHTQSTRETREETGWNNGRWYRTSQHSTRGTEKRPQKQATCRTPKGVEKQVDYMLVDRKHMCCSRVAEANDMAQFVTTTSKKEVSQKHTQRKEENPNSREHKESRRWTNEIWWSKHFFRRAPRWTRKKNQAWSRICSYHTEAENDWVFDYVGACEEHTLWMRMQTPQLPFWSKLMEDLLRMPQQHTIRMRTQTPQQDTNLGEDANITDLGEDAHGMQQQHTIQVKMQTQQQQRKKQR